VRPGTAQPGLAQPGSACGARSAAARPGPAQHGPAQPSLGPARPGPAWLGSNRPGPARPGLARPGPALNSDTTGATGAAAAHRARGHAELRPNKGISATMDFVLHAWSRVCPGWVLLRPGNLQHHQYPATRNRTRNHLIAAALYSQMLYQLSCIRLVVSVPAPSGWAGRVSNRRRAHHERCSDRLFYAHRSKPTIQTQTKQANTTAERSLYFTSATHQRPRRMGRYGCIGCCATDSAMNAVTSH
jgi:hypothetical protein